MFPEPTELLSVGCQIESNLDPKIKYIDTKKQLADTLTKEISHVMSGIIFGVLFSISHFSSTDCFLNKSNPKRIVESSYSASYSRWDDDKAWSSQGCKADELMDDRTVTPVVCPQRGTKTQQFIIGDDETKSDLSLRSRSFLHRVNDQVRKRQKRS